MRLSRSARCIVALFVACASASSAQTERRFALIVGENRGLRSDEPLQFAEEDARRVRDTLVELGGVSEGDVSLLLGTNANALRAEVESLEAALRGAGPGRKRLIVYVSSHAGDGELHLSGTRLPLAELVDFVKRASVDVGVLIVDACRSGAVTRTKGLRPIDQPGEDPEVVVEATGLTGRVFISASGADEFAQESDSLEGSAFTHHFVTGLRGAADRSRDGVVTLDEAYTWAWARTLESTFGSRAGAQRPQVKVDLHGEGELVLTELKRASARITLGVEAPGRWLVVDERSDRVVADLVKREGPLTLAVAPGSYLVKLRTESSGVQRTVRVAAGATVVVKDEELDRIALAERAALKGASDTSQLVLSASGLVASGLVGGLTVQPGAEVRLRRDGLRFGPVNQLSVALAYRNGRNAIPGFAQHEFAVGFGFAHRFLFRGPSLALGLDVGALFVHQYDLPDASKRNAFGPTVALTLEFRLPILKALELLASVNGGGALFKKTLGLAVTPRLAGALGVAVVF